MHQVRHSFTSLIIKISFIYKGARKIDIGHPARTITVIEWKKKFQVRISSFLIGSPLDTLRATSFRIGNKCEVLLDITCCIDTCIVYNMKLIDIFFPVFRNISNSTIRKSSHLPVTKVEEIINYSSDRTHSIEIRF